LGDLGERPFPLWERLSSLDHSRLPPAIPEGILMKILYQTCSDRVVEAVEHNILQHFIGPNRMIVIQRLP